MASSELFEISKSSTFLSRRASAASSDDPNFVGLSVPSGGEIGREDMARDVSMVGSIVGNVAIGTEVIAVVS
jgi:hypothetical protein